MFVVLTVSCESAIGSVRYSPFVTFPVCACVPIDPAWFVWLFVVSVLVLLSTTTVGFPSPIICPLSSANCFSIVEKRRFKSSMSAVIIFFTCSRSFFIVWTVRPSLFQISGVGAPPSFFCICSMSLASD